MKTYIEQCREKSLNFNKESFDDFVAFWHTSDQTRNITLHDAIGISWKEYSENILKNDSLFQLLEKKINE